MLIGEGPELPAEVGLGPWVHAFVKKSAQLAIPQKIEARTYRICFSGWSTPEAFCFFRGDFAVGHRQTACLWRWTGHREIRSNDFARRDLRPR
jgi:hypothetical protein